MMRPTLCLVMMIAMIAATAAVPRQAQLKAFIEVFEIDTVSFGKKSGSDDCLGAPYLYVTTGHDEDATVSKYTRDGCFISDDIIVGGHDSAMDLRGMAIDANGDLLIANAAFGHSQLLLYGTCDEELANFNDNHQRDLHDNRKKKLEKIAV
jgi:hypothetical protein